MRCPYCKHEDSRVTDSRATDDGKSIRRRRQCMSCGRRFTTYEYIDRPPLAVIKRSGGTEMFDANKLLRGISRSCNKRGIDSEVLEGIVKSVEESLRSEGKMEVPTERIGELVLDQLRDIDQVAYVRFASVYRKFDNIDSFMDELEQLKKLSNNRRGRHQQGDSDD